MEITKPLEDQRTTLGEHVTLSCELSRAGTSVRWLKDGKAIRKSQKYDLLSEGTRAVLVVREASIKDSGEYTCETEASRSTARLLVEGKLTTPSVCPAAWPGTTPRTSVEAPAPVSLCAQVGDGDRACILRGALCPRPCLFCPLPRKGKPLHGGAG